MNISIFVKLFHKRINLIAESDMEGHRLLDNKIRENYLTTGASIPMPWHQVGSTLASYKQFQLIRGPAVMHSIGTYCRIFFHIALVEVCSTHGDEGVKRLQLVLTRYLKKHIALKSLYRKDTDKADDIFDRISQLRFILSKSSKIFENLELSSFTCPDYLSEK